MGEKFSLKWNDYLANVTKKFSSLRNEEEFSDVTIDQSQVTSSNSWWRNGRRGGREGGEEGKEEEEDSS